MKTELVSGMKRFNYLNGEINAAYHEMAKKMGLSDSAMMILYAVCDVGDRRPLQEICRSSGLTKQTVNSGLRKLEEQGMVYLIPHGKGKAVCLTEQGRALAEQTAMRMIQAENEVFDSWTPDEISEYLRLTEKYLIDFRKKSGELLTEEV